MLHFIVLFLNWSFPLQTTFGDPSHPQVVIVPDPSGNSKSYPMYATMRHPPAPHAHATVSGSGGELFPEFVPPPPPMFEAGAKPPLPPGKPDKIVCKNPPGKKGEKKRESTV